MTGKIKNFVNRSGRYHARLVVPKDLRGIVGKTELRTPLGGDYRQAIKLLPGAVAELQHKIALAERKQGIQPNAPARYPMTPQQIAVSHYHQRLAFDEELRNDWRYASIGSIDDHYVQQLRDGIAGKLQDNELEDLIGDRVARFQVTGNVDAKFGTDDWRMIARALCSAELEALARVVERHEGDFSGKPTDPLIANAEMPPERPKPVNLKQLWRDYVNVRKNAGYMRDNGKRQMPVIDSLCKHLKHADANRITKADLLGWRDKLIDELSAKTVNDIYLSAIRSLFAWAVENDRLPENVALSVKQPKARKVYNRERGYTDTEAKKVLRASRTYNPKPDEFGNIRESEKAADLKRWVPIICAFTGARVSEITQLRKEDFRKVDGRLVIRITPDAGTVKSGGYRDVPLHKQIIEEGFADFVAKADDGPIFHNADSPEKFQRAAVIVSNKLSDWLRKSGLRPEGLQPNHAWRHRFKTQCRELEISDRVGDAIQGHVGRTASDNYGDVTIKTKADAIDRLPSYDLR